jgi:hypothetical protein
MRKNTVNDSSLGLRSPEPVMNPVEQAVRKLNSLCKQATFDFAIAVGKLVVEEFYGGNLDQWRDRGVKNVSFRKLARHPDLPMSPSALCRSVAIYELCSRLCIKRQGHLSTSHIRLVLPLPWAEQGEVLAQAEAHRWTVHRLREEIVSTHGGDDGEEVEALPRVPVAPPAGLKDTLKTLEGCLDENNEVLGQQTVGELSPDSARTVTELVRRLQNACASLERRVAPFLDGAQTLPPPLVASETTRRIA